MNLFDDTYGENLKDVDTGDVQLFLLERRKGHRDVTEVLREQDDQCCGSV